MFNHDAHYNVWLKLQRCLKRGDTENALELWRVELPSLCDHYDDLRMLYYIGRHGLREAYGFACSTMGYLKDSPPNILRARLAVFRYAVEQSSHGHADISHWMIADLAANLGTTPERFPPPAPEVPKAIAAQIDQLRAAATKR